MHSSWYSRRRIFIGGVAELKMGDAVANRRDSSEVAHNLHFLRFLIHPLDAGGISVALEAGWSGLRNAKSGPGTRLLRTFVK